MTDHIEQLNIAGLAAALAPGGERSTLANEVYERLKLDIFEFRMPPGQRYSEHELAAMLQVSRTPLRLALHVLAHEGFLQHVNGHSGWQVRPLDLSYYEDLYDFRIEIEAVAIRRLCAKSAKIDLSQLIAFWCAPASEQSRDGEAAAREDEVFHRTLVGLAGNAEMLRCYDRLADRIRIIRRLDFVSPARIVATYEEHGAILRALETRRGEEAERLVRAHIEASRVEIRRITFHQMALATSAAEAAVQGK